MTELVSNWVGRPAKSLNLAGMRLARVGLVKITGWGYEDDVINWTDNGVLGKEIELDWSVGWGMEFILELEWSEVWCKLSSFGELSKVKLGMSLEWGKCKVNRDELSEDREV